MLYAARSIGIVAVGVGLLMIGGEFDLSAGVAATTAGLDRGDAQLPVQPEHVGRRALRACRSVLLIGFINGYLVVKTGIPSFLVTLGTFFVLQGANLGVTKLVTGTVATPNISDIDGFDSCEAIFASSFEIGGVTHADHRALVDPLRGASPPGCCCGPGSATGSSRSAATRRAPARSACR